MNNAPTGCAHCLPELRKSFPAYWDFDVWQLSFLQKGFRPVAQPPTAAATIPSWHSPHYCACPECGEVWALSYPENAWRGYFLPAAAAAVRHTRSERQGRLRRLGCLVVLVVIGLWLVARWWGE